MHTAVDTGVKHFDSDCKLTAFDQTNISICFDRMLLIYNRSETGFKKYMLYRAS